ncbi:MAG: LamG domain-containing protein, partial [bacterium]|nr:LamG domain-containing protein [bacterium]
MKQIVWEMDNLECIGGNSVEVVGTPEVIEGPGGKAIVFDGVGDALFLDVHPLAGERVFTMEAVFCPYADGPEEQRFVHLQEEGTENRILFETRLRPGNRWFMDTFINQPGKNLALFARDFEHPVGPWYHVALVVDGRTMRHYLNGEQELCEPLEYQPQTPGRTSLGVRMNRVSWFKGA